MAMPSQPDPRPQEDTVSYEVVDGYTQQVIDVLHGTRRADPAQPVLVAGDPEMATRAERLTRRDAEDAALAAAGD